MDETILCICDRIRPIRGGPEEISGKKSEIYQWEKLCLCGAICSETVPPVCTA